VSVKIRLTRLGARHRPFYRLVVMDSRSARDSKAIDTLGHYDPMSDPPKVEIDEQKVLDWLSRGAEPSVNARALLRRHGLMQKHNLGAEASPPKESTASAEAGARPESGASAESGPSSS
jgi:small subunit ribosomal protein S16